MRRSLLLVAGTAATILINIHLAVHEKVAVFLIVLLSDLVFFVHVRVRRREGRINVLRSNLVLSCLALLHGREVGLLQRAIFVQSATDKVSAVWQFRSRWPADFDSQCLGTRLFVNLHGDAIGLTG